MAGQEFRASRIILNRIYTRGGDAGKTMLVNGRRVPKDDPRVEGYGTVDELNALVGRARMCLEAEQNTFQELGRLGEILLRVQHELFNLGSEVATDPGSLGARQPRILLAHVTRLESEIDELNEELPELPSFVLPGGSALTAELHVCRAACRRAERRIVSLARSETGLDLPLRYLNRLSDAFFVWSRWACRTAGHAETLWDANLTS